MRRTLLALVIALAMMPAASDACCDLDRPVAPVRAATVDASCPLHAGGGSESTTPLPQPRTPTRCAHDLSIDRAGLVKTVATAAPDLATILTARTAALPVVFTSHPPAAPQHAPPRRAARPDVLRI